MNGLGLETVHHSLLLAVGLLAATFTHSQGSSRGGNFFNLRTTFWESPGSQPQPEHISPSRYARGIFRAGKNTWGDHRAGSLRGTACRYGLWNGKRAKIHKERPRHIWPRCLKPKGKGWVMPPVATWDAARTAMNS